MYNVSVYDRSHDGRLEERQRADSLEAAEQLRRDLVRARGEGFDVVIEDHAHPTEVHELGSHGDWVIGSAEGRIGAWRSGETWRSFIPAEELKDAEIREACAAYHNSALASNGQLAG